MNIRWKAAFLLLLLLFGYFFWRFFSAAYEIQHSVKEINDNGSANRSGRHIVLISQEHDNPYWKTVFAGAKKAADENGMQLEYTGPIIINPEEQLALMDKAIAARADGLLVQGSKDRRFADLIKKAHARHIPVVAVDTDTKAKEKVSYAGTDNFAAGAALGKMMAEGMNGKGEAGIIIGSSTAENHQLRLNGMLSMLKKYPDIKIAGIVSSNISRIESARQAEKLMKEHPGITAMAGTSALDSLGIVQAYKSIPRKKLKIYGFDLLKETETLIREGKIDGVVSQEPRQMGYDAVLLLRDFYEGKQAASEHFTNWHLITPQSLEGEDSE